MFSGITIAPGGYTFPTILSILEKPETTRIAPHINGENVAILKVKDVIPRLEQLTDDLMRKTGVPGLAIAIVHKDEVVYLKGFGVREAGKPELVDPDTIFQLASLSKPIASTIVAGVVGDKKVTWDDPIIKYLPDFRMGNPYVTSQVTIRDMFSHRSGLPDHAGDDLEDLGFDRITILQRLRYLPIEGRFRSVYNYTNFGLTAGAEAVASSTGKPWETLAQERLYRPLGMTRTSSRYIDFDRADNHARGHVLIDGEWVAKYRRQPDAESPAGGVSSTVRDLAGWMRLQLGGGFFAGQQIIAPAALGETHLPHMVSKSPQNPTTERASFYGLGWGVNYTDNGQVELSHSGAFNLGVATAVYLLPAQGLGIVVLTNAHPIGLPESIALSFLDLARFGEVRRDYFELVNNVFVTEIDKPNYGRSDNYSKAPANPSPALPVSAYVGTYSNDYFGDVEIVARNGKLVLLSGQKQQSFKLQHYDRDLFTYQPAGENAFGKSAVTFIIGTDGKSAKVTIENLNIDGQGTFKRRRK